MGYTKRVQDHPTVPRTVIIHWKPRTKEEWAAFTASRRDAAELWNRMARIHTCCRQRRWKWPKKAAFRRWATNNRNRGRAFTALHSQSCQEIIDQFLTNIEATSSKRRKARARGDEKALKQIFYPSAGRSRYRDVIYKNNQARIQDDYVVLPNGASQTLRIPLPAGYEGKRTGSTDNYLWVDGKPLGRMMRATLTFGALYLSFDSEASEDVAGSEIGVDLGVNTLIAATDGVKALLISGRGIKSLVRYRNKKLGEITQKQTKKTQGITKTKGSRSWKKLQRAKRKLLERNKRQINDAIHKATRQVADAFPGATAFVGKPFNDAARKVDRKRAQTVSSACNRKIIEKLGYKLKEAKEVEEHYTSQTCPGCGVRKKCKRIYHCKCGFTAPRDVVGAVNIRSKGQTGSIATGTAVPTSLTYSRPGATRDCDRAGIHGLQLPLGEVADVRVEGKGNA